MNEQVLAVLNATFEDHEVTTIMYRGKPCWMARQIGALLGYADEGRRFTTKVMDEWSDEILVDIDVMKIEGEELTEFKKLLELYPESGYSLKHAPVVILLTETGLNLALMKTEKPEGKRLRRFIADEVLPQIHRDGVYLPGRTVDPQSTQIESSEERKLVVAEAREARLNRMQQEKAMEKLVRILKAAGTYDARTIQMYEIEAVEAAMGRNLTALKPAVEPSWLTPTEIAARCNTTANHIGRIITDLGLRGNVPGMARAVLNKAQYSDRTVTSYVYSPKAVEEIEHMLNRTRVRG